MERKERLATSALSDLIQKRTEVAGKYGAETSEKSFLVLVVDDSIDNVVVISLDLQNEGYRVVTASNGEEAISVASLTHPQLILMDISMPRLDGFAATRKIREMGVRLRSWIEGRPMPE